MATAIIEPASSTDQLQRIPLEQIHESPHNPRIHYDPEALSQLADSLLQSGQLEPVLVRPRKGGAYELAAGHRRFRAAKLAIERSAAGARHRQLETLLAIVRDLDDKAFIETLNVDNLQRADLHPLEEAQGFRDLMTSCGYDIKKISARIGKSERYVYDSLTLLKLIPEARKLFLAGRFERAHAIELARLTAEWQKTALDTDAARQFKVGGLFVAEDVGIDPSAPKQERLQLEDAVKAVSVREFKKWVNERVRFKPAETDPVLFPDTAALVSKAVLDKEKVVEITYEYQVDPEVKDEKAPKIYGAQAWRSATKDRVSPDVLGLSHAGEGKPCEHSVVGVIVIGEGRGEAFRVCIAKDKCKVHWADRLRKKPKTTATAKGREHDQDSYQQQLERQRREEEQRKQEAARWKKALPQLFKALAAKIKVAPVTGGGAIAKVVIARCRATYGPGTGAGKYYPVDRSIPTAEQLLRFAAFLAVAARGAHDYSLASSMKQVCKAWGVNAAKIVDTVAPKPKPEKPAKQTKGKKAK